MKKESQYLSEKEIYKGPIFKLVQRTVEIKGKEYLRDVVINTGGVCVLVIKDDKVLLVKQYRYGVEDYTIELPAGKLESDENIQECALRELNEETGLDTGDIQFVQKIATTPAFCREIVYIYQANDVFETENRLDMDEDEDIELKWYPLDEAYEMIQTGKIIDAKTVVAIQNAIIQKYRKGDAE